MNPLLKGCYPGEITVRVECPHCASHNYHTISIKVENGTRECDRCGKDYIITK